MIKYLSLILFIAGCATVTHNDYIVGMNENGDPISHKMVSSCHTYPLQSSPCYTSVWRCVDGVCDGEVVSEHWSVDDGEGWLTRILQGLSFGIPIGLGLANSGDSVTAIGSNASATGGNPSAAAGASAQSSATVNPP